MKKRRMPFWRNFKFKYKLTIINENTLEEVVGIHVSKLNGVSVLLTAFLIIFLVTSVIIIWTPLRNYLPGYMNTEVRSQIVNNALRADSLQLALMRQNQYILNIQDILSGKVKADSVGSIDSLTTARAEELVGRSPQEEEFRKKYEEQERYNLNAVGKDQAVAGLVFYRPTRGVMSNNFSPDRRHFGVDITANPHESIVATLDGTVILATYTANYGYVMQVQHSQNLVSVYKHCGTMLKQEGDRVKGGEVIALISEKKNEGETQPHLHFEMWKNGNPINPEKYIVF